MIDLWEARPRVTCKPSVVHKLQDDAEGDAIDRDGGRAVYMKNYRAAQGADLLEKARKRQKVRRDRQKREREAGHGG